MSITVLFPTATEASLFQHPRVQTVISGVRLTATAHQTSKLIAQHRPDWLIWPALPGVPARRAGGGRGGAGGFRAGGRFGVFHPQALPIWRICRWTWTLPAATPCIARMWTPSAVYPWRAVCR